MGAATAISLEEYLRTSYRPDREYRDGLLLERYCGERSHSEVQVAVSSYLGNRRKEWKLAVYISLRIKMRDGWYGVPDVCAYALPEPEGVYPERPPLLWIEVLSSDERFADLAGKAEESVACGTPYVWIIDPKSLASELRTATGVTQILDGTLRVPDSPIEIPLQAALDE